jgi:hypothetical protein
MEIVLSFVILGIIVYMFISIMRIDATIQQVRDLAKQESEYRIHTYAVLYQIMQGKPKDGNWPPSPKLLQSLVKLSNSQGKQNRDSYEKLKAEYQEAYKAN